MKLHTPVETLAASVYHAAHAALPDYVYEMVDHAATYQMPTEERRAGQEREQRGEVVFPRRTITQRPHISQCVVRYMFPQLWNSTALGFGSIGGAAMTDAYTVIIEGPGGHLAVYWSGRFGYLVDPAQQTPEQKAAFAGDVAAFRTASRRDAVGRYGVQLPGAKGDDEAADE